MMQGDEYSIMISGSGFDIDDVDMIEFTIGTITKKYPDTVSYDSVSGKFLFPITQQEMFSFTPGVLYYAQARVKFEDTNCVIGAKMGSFIVDKSLSKQVL